MSHCRKQKVLFMAELLRTEFSMQLSMHRRQNYHHHLTLVRLSLSLPTAVHNVRSWCTTTKRHQRPGLFENFMVQCYSR